MVRERNFGHVSLTDDLTPLQLITLSRGHCNAQVVQSVEGKRSMSNEATDTYYSTIDASTYGPSPYGEQIQQHTHSSSWVSYPLILVEPVSTTPATTFLQVSSPLARVPSYHKRQLSRGNFLVQYKDIDIVDSIGRGLYCKQLITGADLFSIQGSLEKSTRPGRGHQIQKSL